MRPTLIGLLLAVTVASSGPGPGTRHPDRTSNFRTEPEIKMGIKRITPVLYVEEIEPVLPFWVE
ncbi:MAG: hypothetical protein GWN82_23975, partial [Gemmatimonadetes bacterium]|nr:hypothetical protein [Gemmatimonadota bacterium]NIW66720.1 hypothetical protein [Gemmatimonadota bacterium]